jgi:Tol biopolymer transport system component
MEVFMGQISFSNKSQAMLFSLMLFASALSGQQYDIYILDVKNGTQQKIANGLQANMFNAAWSNNGKKIAYDVVGGPAFPFDQSIYISDLQSDITTALAGAEGGNDAAWSPDGGQIAFDAWEDYYQFNWWTQNIYTVPSSGGTRSMIRFNAHHPSWNPAGNKIAFDDNFGYIGTKDLFTGVETFITGIGQRPSWSPDGEYIAFDGASWIGGGIWLIKVDSSGYPVGWPVQVSATGYGATWKNNSKEIVFIDWPAGDPDLYSLPVTGGIAARVCGRVGGFDQGDYDPAYSNNGQFLMWSGFTDGSFNTTAGINGQTGKSDTKHLLKKGFTLEQNFPNPFADQTTIGFRIEEATPVVLTVYNMAGQKVYTLINKNYTEGFYVATWDRRDDKGNKLPAGVYIYYLQTKDSKLSGRMSVMR